MLILKRLYRQREIEFPSAQIVLSDRRQNPLAVYVTILHISFNKWSSRKNINSVLPWCVKVLSWKQRWINFGYLNEYKCLKSQNVLIWFGDIVIASWMQKLSESLQNLSVQPQAVNYWLLRNKPKCKYLLMLQITKLPCLRCLRKQGLRMACQPSLYK